MVACARGARGCSACAGPARRSRGSATTTYALITGANKGIGFETARQLAQRGFHVFVEARDAGRGAAAVRDLTDAGHAATFVALGVTDGASVAAAVETVSAITDHLDVLVNNAGVPSVNGVRTTPSTSSVEDMKAVYETNVFGVVPVTNAFLPLLRRAPAARIVNVPNEVGSMTSATAPSSPLSSVPGSAQYPSSKAAVNMLTVQYAKELRESGIKVNAANPRFTDTDFTQHRGIRAVEQGAEPSVHLSTLDADGPTGVLYGRLWTTEGDGDGGHGILPW